MNEPDWFDALGETADRFRMEEEHTQSVPDEKPRVAKRPYATPSGATARSMKAKNAYQRVQRKRGNNAGRT